MEIQCDHCERNDFKTEHAKKVHMGRSHKTTFSSHIPSVGTNDSAPDVVDIISDVISDAKAIHKLSVSAQEILTKALTIGLIFATVRLYLEPTEDEKPITDQEKKLLAPNKEMRHRMFAPLFYLIEMNNSAVSGINKLASHNDLLMSVAAWTGYIRTVSSIKSNHSTERQSNGIF